MDGSAFDRITRLLAGRMSRRSLAIIAALSGFPGAGSARSERKPVERPGAEALKCSRAKRCPECKRCRKGKCVNKPDGGRCRTGACRRGRCAATPVACAGPSRLCGGMCIAPGGCCADTDCPGTPCIGNLCADCPAGQRTCGGRCIPGSACCANADCDNEQTCQGGTCACPSGTIPCGTACLPAGSCCGDGDCGQGMSCSRGACACPAGTRLCGGWCHRCCGDDECGAGAACIDGRCQAVGCVTAGEICSSAGECCGAGSACTRGSGGCSTFFATCRHAPGGTCDSDCDCANGLCEGNRCSCLGLQDTTCATNDNCCQDGGPTRCATPGQEACGLSFLKRCCRPPGGACGSTCDCCEGSCSSGTCACPAGQKPCKGVCILASQCCVSADCGGGMECASETCRCPSGTKPCGGACIPGGDCCSDADCGGDSPYCVNGACARCPAGYHFESGQLSDPCGGSTPYFACVEDGSYFCGPAVHCRNGQKCRRTVLVCSVDYSCVA